MKVIKVDENNFEAEVIKETKTVVVDFNADWCGPCRMLAPVIEQLAAENENVKFVSVNIDDNEDLAERYDVRSIPCIVVLKDGNEINRSIGYKPKAAIASLFGGK